MGGQADRVQPGVLEMQRKQQGMTVLADLFNSLRRYRKEQGRLLLWFIQTFISDGRLIRISGQEDAQYVPLVHQPGVVEYDVIVDDAPTSPNMKERAWAALVQLFPIFARLNPPPQVLAEALKYAPLPLDFVNKVSQLMEQQSQRPNGQMVLDQAKAEDMQAAAGLKKAQAQKAATEAQMLPQQLAAETQQRQAQVEHLRASALNQLQNASLAPTDRNLEGLDLGLRAVQQHHDQMHQHMMDHVNYALDAYQALHPPEPAQPKP